MNKKIKVIELLNLLAENKIKPGTRIKYYNTIYIIDFPNLCGIYPEEGTTNADHSLFAKLDICGLNYEVEILEDEEEIDIEGIGELPIYESDKSFYDEYSIKANRYKINELVRAVKQLDKKINRED